VQKAWIAHDVPQCGYCQSGMIMAVAALPKDKPKPTDADNDAEDTQICPRRPLQQGGEAGQHAAHPGGGEARITCRKLIAPPSWWARGRWVAAWRWGSTCRLARRSCAPRTARRKSPPGS